MMLLTLTPRKANDAALKPVILAAEKLGTKVARSPISRGAAWLMSDESTADTATGAVGRWVFRRAAVPTDYERPAPPTPLSTGPDLGAPPCGGPPGPLGTEGK